MERNIIYNENCLETLSRMGDGSVDLVLTSPPYGELRDYKGYHYDFDSIAPELVRVVSGGGCIVWVEGDQTVNFCESLHSFKHAITFVELGMNLLDTMIYYKTSYAPAYPSMKRYANQFEYMFVFSKGKPKVFNPVQVEKPAGAYSNKKCKFRQKDGTLREKVITCTRITKDASNVWQYNVGGNTTGHPAVFPLQLAKDHISTWTNESDLVYDPFVGSGTTALACIELGRCYVGSEIAKEYCDIANNRIGVVCKQF